MINTDELFNKFYILLTVFVRMAEGSEAYARNLLLNINDFTVVIDFQEEAITDVVLLGLTSIEITFSNKLDLPVKCVFSSTGLDYSFEDYVILLDSVYKKYGSLEKTEQYLVLDYELIAPDNEDISVDINAFKLSYYLTSSPGSHWKCFNKIVDRLYSMYFNKVFKLKADYERLDIMVKQLCNFRYPNKYVVLDELISVSNFILNDSDLEVMGNIELLSDTLENISTKDIIYCELDIEGLNLSLHMLSTLSNYIKKHMQLDLTITLPGELYDTYSYVLKRKVGNIHVKVE